MNKEFFFEGNAEDFNLESDLIGYIEDHQELKKSYQRLVDMYMGNHEILNQPTKERYKPDNRLVVNHAKYIVDTFNGYFMGTPVKTVADSPGVADYISDVERLNDVDDNNYDLSKKCSIFGHAFELLFIDEESRIGVSQITPLECFIVKDSSIRKRPILGVRYRELDGDEFEGTASDKDYIYYFRIKNGKVTIDNQENHSFGEVPIIEYVENEERLGAFEPVMTLIDSYNKVISEKANDTDYFADAYMKILGAELDEKTLKNLRDYRIINLAQDFESGSLEVDFMDKPNADTTQENLLNRLERHIFAISMVANINDETFGTTSGIALKYKLLSMSNLANTKERKFVKGFNKRYELIANVPNSKINHDDLVDINFKFTRNAPANVAEEVELVRGLQGLLSDETLIEQLSFVDDVKKELERKDEESRMPAQYAFEYDEVTKDVEAETEENSVYHEEGEGLSEKA